MAAPHFGHIKGRVKVRQLHCKPLSMVTGQGRHTTTLSGSEEVTRRKWVLQKFAALCPVLWGHLKKCMMKLFVHSTTQDNMKYSVWAYTYLQALSHKCPQVRPIGIDSLQKTKLHEMQEAYVMKKAVYVEKLADSCADFTTKVRDISVKSQPRQNHTSEHYTGNLNITQVSCRSL